MSRPTSTLVLVLMLVPGLLPAPVVKTISFADACPDIQGCFVDRADSCAWLIQKSPRLPEGVICARIARLPLKLSGVAGAMFSPEFGFALIRRDRLNAAEGFWEGMRRLRAEMWPPPG